MTAPAPTLPPLRSPFTAVSRRRRIPIRVLDQYQATWPFLFSRARPELPLGGCGAVLASPGPDIGVPVTIKRRSGGPSAA
jgi:hypothetical protein